MNQPEIKLLSTDLDGTVFGMPDALVRFQTAWQMVPVEQRPLLVYNSGRRVDDILSLIESGELAGPDYVIGGVGTEIYDFRKSEWRVDFHQVLDAGWDYEQVRSITAQVPGIEPQPDEFVHKFKSSWYLYRATTRQLDALRQSLLRAGIRAEVVYSSDRDLDVLPALANKGNALKWFCGQLGIALNQCIVAGDTANDSAMFLLNEVYGIVPKNVQPELLEQLFDCRVYQASQPMADGILEGLVHYGVLPGSETDDRFER
ncbi:MAG: HAD-IIB family hydrolase [Verrucomicrobiota bacterium]